MSMQDLFGSDSENSDGGDKPSHIQDEELPSTQAHMNELFGAASDENASDDEATRQNNSDDEAIGQNGSGDDMTKQNHSDDEDTTRNSIDEATRQDSSDDEATRQNNSDDEATRPNASVNEEKENISSDSSSDEETTSSNINRPSALNAAPENTTPENKSSSEDDDDDDDDLKRPTRQQISDISDDEDENEQSNQTVEQTQSRDKDGVDEEADKAMPTTQDLFGEVDKVMPTTQDLFGEVDKVMPTTQDLFGEELDVSSDEEEGKKTPEPMDEEPSQKVREEGDQEQQEESERPPTPEKEEEGLSIAIELPKCNISLGKELYFIKLPNFLSVDTKPFDTNFYEDEIDEDEIQDEEGRARLKLKVENTIRWRYSKDKDDNEIKESNCRFVRWSDGSLSMHLGNEVFDVFKMPVQGEQNHLFVQQGTGLQAQAVFKNKLSFRPHSTTSQTHRKMTMSIADRMQKAQRIKMMPAMERDPENQRSTALKKEEERLRTQTRRENQQRRMREKSQSKGLTSNYLDQDMDDEEDFEHSIAAIKNKYSKDVKGARNKPTVYSSDSDEGEEKLRSAKLDIESDDDADDDDEEIKRKREELAKKKKQGRKVIEESDEESD